MLSSIALTLVFLVIVWIATKKSKPDKFPPGPPSLPFLGSVPFLLGYKGVLSTFYNLTKKYGPIVGYISGGRPKVIIGDADIIRELYSMEAVSNRPHQGMRGAFRYGGRIGPVRGLLFSSGEEWKEQRRFVMRSLGEFGFGRKSMDSLISDEAINLRNFLETQCDITFDLNLNMNTAIVNSLWTITVGEPLDFNDPIVKNTVAKIDKAIKNASHMNPLTILFPKLQKMFPQYFGYEHMTTAVTMLKDMINKFIDDHEETFDNQHMRDLLDMYIQKRSTAKNGSTFHGKVGEQNQQIGLLDLFIAGTETTSTTLMWAILFLLHHPEVQTKLHKELDEVVGSSMPSMMEDDKNLPYTKAVIKEVLRCSSIIYAGIPHMTSKTLKIRGYEIPAGTTILANICYVMHDPDKWEEPDVFNPDRFLNAPHNPNFMPFLVGKRFCLGQALAEKQLFIFFTTLVQNFWFACPEGEVLPSYDILPKDGSTTSNSIVRYAPPYKVVMTNRNNTEHVEKKKKPKLGKSRSGWSISFDFDSQMEI
eukprot:GFUD01026100.1.p1 GENE.GFUD01026100.1~~GFUD01026100.1.p1  ORF type:complete len:533 (+),score=117.47 GFUD01026100.1:101-1699(+)